jgi:hypothetical protein
MTGGPQGDPFKPDGEHAALLEEMRERAHADALRHAEDLMERPLPIVDEVEALGQERLVRLGHRRQELKSIAERAHGAATEEQNAAQARFDAALAALTAEGVPHEQLALEPLDRSVSPRAILAMAAIATVAATVTGALWLGAMGATIALVVCLALATGLCVALYVPSSTRAETARLSALRRERRRAAAELRRLSAHRDDAAREVEEMPQRAQNLFEGELTLVRSLVSTYESELFRALPPGALADGKGLGDQRTPHLVPPAWAGEPVNA